MANFAVEHIEQVIGRINFYHLIVDGANQYKEFEEQLLQHGGYESELNKIPVLMQQVSEGKTLPSTKFKDITPKKETVKEYEIKTRNLRCYLFHEKERGRIVVLLGKKTTQKQDIKRFRNLKSQYLETI